MQKIKTKIKQWFADHKWHIFYPFLIASFLIIYLIGYPASLKAMAETIGITAHQKETPIQKVEAKEEVKEVKELDMKSWVLNEFEKAGLNINVADCVIWGESGWDNQAMNIKTYDFGLMQWNIQHIKSGLITPSCAFDYKCSVTAAIKKVLADKGWSAWYGYKNNNCQRFGNTFIN